MDAHYFKVMKAREDISETGTKLYFAYSGVLDQDAFAQWRQEHSYNFFELPPAKLAEAKDVDLTFDFPSRWWGGRVAGLTEKKGSRIYGLLFEVEAKNWPVIQHKEGVVTGMSVEKPIEVLVDGKLVQATVFVTNPTRASLEGSVSARYLEAIVRGAEKSGLPAEYIDRLKTMG